MNNAIQKPARIQWIDFMKAMAIFAVLVDHTRGELYTNRTFQFISFYSVSLFIIVSGITSYNSYEKNKGISYGQDIKRKLKAILIPYGIATIVYTTFSLNWTFDLMTFITTFLNFKADAVFYFVLFYIQLMLISKPLCMFVSSVKEAKRPGYQKALIHLIATALLMYAAHIFINHTFMLNVHGAGKILFGGTWLFVYYIGIVIGSYVDKPLPRSQKINNSYIYIYIYILIVCSFLCVVLVKGILTKGCYFGTVPFWGGGFNPPESRLIVYAFSVFGLLFSLNRLIDHFGFKPVVFCRNVIAWFGKNSLYIFLFHRIILKMLAQSSFAEWSVGHIWIKRFVYMGAMIFLSTVTGIFINRILKHGREDFTGLLDWIKK